MDWVFGRLCIDPLARDGKYWFKKTVPSSMAPVFGDGLQPFPYKKTDH